MVSEVFYTALVLGVALERLVELRVSARNRAWSLERGGREYGQGHFPFMVVIHVGLLVGCVAEVWLLERVFSWALGGPMLVLALSCQGLRWWVIATLGHRWNTRVIVVPGLPRIVRGPFRFVRHPNYVAVVVEGFALPLVHGAWITALVFSALDAWVLWLRIRCEDAALREACPEPSTAGAA